ncbi:MAG: flagellar M-ring protein FliF [Gammaproteobacteria bacterium]|nr:flagellar basal body M-ring protein FliF [Rhodocyclaceae bacterium]MBU3909544.1 flagellar M-ring protein FliF [Gammaproteobacteria bacterium]MBU4003207.1 flagellar M-ring protein FliF [Gammaproteobacteria bacterium]MBU4022256.1 flagellar M-ring protein FliF [Gammaproteobacteria bacterium]MBU4097563.1 flagellar M-ring protein FliF [Gammaproteobacteria bacterium]
MAEQATASSVSASPLSLAALSNLDARQKMGAAVAIALAIAILVGAWLWTKEPPYGVLFSNLNDQDGGQIVTSLQQQNIPYKFSASGGAIMVPSSMVHDARLRLASQGLPKGGLVGFEVMENQKLGISQFAEQINYQRGLEGELARTIQTLAAVRGARVHLAIPKQTAFLRDDLKPSASVLVGLQPGRSLEPAQIAGIVHLVSSSVPQLNPANVSVIDQNGNLISQQQDSLKNASLNPNQIKYVKDVEAQYLQRVETILEPLVGKGNFRAQVAAELDFSNVDQVAETYKPNPVPEATIRSQQTAETGAGNPPAIGVPGALTNQPPVPATAPITNPQVGGAAAGAGQNNNYTRNATINYEVDKTVRHTRGPPGMVKRLSVAVVVNHKKGPEKDSKPGKPPTAEELKRINDLVREAVGFNQTRGDSINVAAASFVPPEPEVVPEIQLWQDPELIALGKELGKYLVFALIVYLIWTKLMKPLFATLAAAAQRAEAEQKAEASRMKETSESYRATHGMTSYDDKVKAARDVAQQDPKLVAEMIKGWMGANGT